MYATVDDLVPLWLDEAPENVNRLIMAASRLVDGATRLDRYVVDTAGMPVDDTIRDAFRDAVCQQVAVWFHAGVDPFKGAVQDPKIASQSAEGASVSYQGVLTVEQLAQVAKNLDDMAVLILRNAGLCKTRVTLV